MASAGKIRDVRKAGSGVQIFAEEVKNPHKYVVHK
jgi:dTDP-glucose pyrophosphorylase